MAATVKIGPEIDRKLYAEFVRLAKKNGQSQRFLLEKAIEHYIQFVAPSNKTIRPEAMGHFRRSTDKNRKLHELLA
jgi:predicted transcriptional regulator